MGNIIKALDRMSGCKGGYKVTRLQGYKVAVKFRIGSGEKFAFLTGLLAFKPYKTSFYCF